MAKAKAKEYFKNLASETFRHLKKAFGDQQLQYILPQTYINQVIENVKQELDYSVHHLTDQILEVLALWGEFSNVYFSRYQVIKIHLSTQTATKFKRNPRREKPKFPRRP